MPNDKVMSRTPALHRKRCLDAVKERKEFLLNAPQKVDTERLRCLLDAYKEYDFESTIVKRARVFEKLLHTKHLYIDNNPIVGTVTSRPAGVYVFPEWDSEWIIKEMRLAMMSHLGQVNISDEDKKLMLEAGKYFKTRSAHNKARSLSIEMHDFDPEPTIKAGVFSDGALFTVGAGNVDYDTFVRKGLNQIIAETEERLSNIVVTTETTNKVDFYRAALIVLRSMVHLAGRYADLAEELAAEEEDVLRKAELLEIADVCRNVPANPPRNFREAVQSWWFCHLGVQMEQTGCGSSPGRLGQYLDPYFQKDKEENDITREDGIVLLKCLFVKILEIGYYQGLAYSQLVSGHTGHSISIGGVKADGSDATTELDYMLLDTQIDLNNIQPTLTMLYHDGLQEDFLMKAVDLERTGLGQPQWLNNDVIIQRLLARHAKNGVTLADARNCANLSCVGTGIAGRTAFIREIATFNLAKMAEFIMTNGYDFNTEKQIGDKTGNPEDFKTFEDVFAAFDKQVNFMFSRIRPYGSLSNKALGDIVPSPWRSIMYGGCLERGKHECEFSMYIAVTAGIPRVSFTSLQIVPQAVPYLPALTAGPAMKRSTS